MPLLYVKKAFPFPLLHYSYWYYLPICYVAKYIKWVSLFLSRSASSSIAYNIFGNVQCNSLFPPLLPYRHAAHKSFSISNIISVQLCNTLKPQRVRICFYIINHLLKYKSSECTWCNIMKHSIKSSYWMRLLIITDTVPSTTHHSPAAQTFTSTRL